MGSLVNTERLLIYFIFRTYLLINMFANIKGLMEKLARSLKINNEEFQE